MISTRLQITGKVNGTIKNIYPELEDITINPSTEKQVIKSSKYGINEVTVNEVTSDIDENIKPENIVIGKKILGVDGGFEGVDSSDATATFGDILKGKTAYVNNKKIEGGYAPLDTTDATADSNDILKGKTAYVNEQKIEGTIEEYDGNYGIEISDANGATLNTANKYCKENIVINLEAEEITVPPTLEDQTREGLFRKVTIPAIEGEEASLVPTTETQIKEGVFTSVVIPGDASLISENIKDGESIFGVQGNYKGDSSYNAVIKNDGTTTFNIKTWITAINGLDVGNKAVSMASAFSSYTNLTKFTMINSDKVTKMNGMLSSCSNLEYIGDIDASNCTSLNGVIRDCTKLTKMPKITTTSTLTDLGSMFSGDTALTDISNFFEMDLSGAYYFSYLFNNCNKLKYIPFLNLPSATDVTYMYQNCTALEEIGGLSIPKAQSIRNLFYMCTGLKTIPEIDCSKINFAANQVFYGCSALENFGGLKDIGKGYYQTIANYVQLILDFTYCTALTHDSLMNIINKLYDLNLTYGVATGGTLYPQMLVLGETNLAKLTAEEIRNSDSEADGMCLKRKEKCKNVFI